MRSVLGLAALLFAMLGAGCGSTSADQARAERAVLRSSDLPGGTGGGGLGWYADKWDVEALAGGCLDEDPGFVATGRAHSDWFLSPASWSLRDWQMASLSFVYETSAQAALEPVADHVGACFARARAGGGAGAVKTRQIPFPQTGERSLMVEVRSEDEIFGRTYDYVVLTAKGRALTLLYVVSHSDETDDRLLARFAKTLASRM